MKAHLFSCFDFVTSGTPTARFGEYRVASIEIKKAPNKKERASKINERLRNAKAKKT